MANLFKRHSLANHLIPEFWNVSKIGISLLNKHCTCPALPLQAGTVHQEPDMHEWHRS
jgi:hypothetical protein